MTKGRRFISYYKGHALTLVSQEFGKYHLVRQRFIFDMKVTSNCKTVQNRDRYTNIRRTYF